MAKTYKSSKKNKPIISEVSRILALGSENHIARLAIVHSLNNWTTDTNLKSQDSGGKEYSQGVLFGEHEYAYRLMIAERHSISYKDPIVDELIKLHLDNGIEQLEQIILTEERVQTLEEFIDEFCINLVL